MWLIWRFHGKYKFVVLVIHDTESFKIPPHGTQGCIYPTSWNTRMHLSYLMEHKDAFILPHGTQGCIYPTSWNTRMHLSYLMEHKDAFILPHGTQGYIYPTSWNTRMHLSYLMEHKDAFILPHGTQGCIYPVQSISCMAGDDLLTITVETLYSTIYYSKYFIELNFNKLTQYVALWTHKRHPIPRPFGRAMECLLWVLEQKLIVL